MTLFKKTLTVSLVALAVAGCTQQEKYPVSEQAPTTEADKVGYAFGASIGMIVKENLVEQEKYDLNYDRQQVIAGFVDAVKAESKLSQEEIQTLMTTFQDTYAEARTTKLVNASKEKGDAFRAENAKKEGVKTTESGLQYEVLQEGPEGAASPAADDVVEVHYHGTLVDGTVFDSSVERGKPLNIPVNRVIEGFSEGLQMMTVGDKYRFVIPPEIAYGEQESQQIPPMSTLIFEVELLDIKEKPKAEEDAAADVEVGS